VKEKSDFIFGFRTIIEAIDAGKEVNKILLKKGLQSELYAELRKRIKEREIPVQFVPDQKLNSISRKNHQGVIAFISPVEYYILEQLVPTLYESGKTPFILMLDGVTDVRNFGAIARTAECAGVDAIISPKKGGAQVTSDAIKTSAGALHKIPVCRVDSLSKTIVYLQEYGFQVIATSEKTNDNYFSIDLTPPTVLVMGAEDKGISDDIIRTADRMARIPVLGSISSLNVSVAAGIIIYEMVKQRLNNTN
jgi:23S rRNA (guanosine2251-2'-O)-methyltransferase